MAANADDFAALAAGAAAASGVPVACTGAARFGPQLAAGRFRLGNGLTVVLAANHAAPIFAYQTWFKVGSKHEDPARTGLAHLFEHLMFKGTPRHPTGSFDREMERRGSQTNAATWVDWTYYTCALAARGDNLATVIDFEADRMVNLIVDEATFRSELEVVKNERRMSVDDSVGGTLGEQLLDLAYTAHPYRWPTIGSMAHLDVATVDELRAFYRRFYAPNNATVVLVGDLDVGPTLASLARAYGPLSPQPIVHRARPPEPPQRGARQRHIARPLAAAQMVLGYPAPPQGHPDFAAMEMLAEVLVSGDTGRLVQRLMARDQLVTDVSGSVAPFAEPGLFEFHVTARPEVGAEQVLTALQEELGRLADGIDPFEIDKGRHGLEVGLLDTLKDVEGCAEALGHHETNFGRFDQAFAPLAAWQAVTAPQMQALARRLFDPAAANVVVAQPDGSVAVDDGDDTDDAGEGAARG